MIMLATFLGVIIAILLVVFILRCISMVVINIPGFTDFYGYIMLIIPYGIFFTTYYFLRSKLALTIGKTSKILGTIFFTLGFLACIASLIIASVNFIKTINHIELSFEEISHYFLVIQLGFIFIITMTLGLGDAKEEDWLDKHKNAK
jgi:predicted transporter